MPENEQSSYSTDGSASPSPKAEKPHEVRPQYSLTKRAVVAGLIAGVIGGGLGSYGFIRYFSNAIPADKKQLVVQESSAVVDVAKKVSPSVVSVTSKSVSRGFYGQPIQSEGAGTGIIVTSDGLILTNKHVVMDTGASYTVVMPDGKQYAAQVVSRDPINDMAFLRINASGLPAAQLGDSSMVQVGQRVVAIGNALGQFQNTVTDGIISGLSRQVVAGDQQNAEQLQNVLQTDAAINPGNSGGPLVNLDGQVIGINTAVAGQQAQNIGFAIPINEAKPLIASVKSQGRIVRPYLGVRYIPLTKDIAAANNLSVSEGAWVQGDTQNPGVVPGSPAEKAGIKEGDVITKLGNDKVTPTMSLQALASKHKAGDKVSVTIVRDKKEQTLDVTLGEAPSTQ